MKELSQHASMKLSVIGRSETAETAETLHRLFLEHKLTPFEPVIEAFLRFGGFCLPFEPEGRFKILRAKAAIRQKFGRSIQSDDPSVFRLPFGQSETVQAFYLIDGHGHLFEDDTRIADSLVDWIEKWAK